MSTPTEERLRERVKYLEGIILQWKKGHADDLIRESNYLKQLRLKEDFAKSAAYIKGIDPFESPFEHLKQSALKKE